MAPPDLFYWFRSSHLDEDLQKIAKPFEDLARLLVEMQGPDGEEQRMALRNLHALVSGVSLAGQAASAGPACAHTHEFDQAGKQGVLPSHRV